jgi:hypothetical protein
MMIPRSSYEPRPFFWCETCGKRVDEFSRDRLLSLGGIVVRTRCHGLVDSAVVFDEEIERTRPRVFPRLVFFRLPPRALAPIAPPAPPKRRGRLLPAPDASRTVVWNVGPMERTS